MSLQQQYGVTVLGDDGCGRTSVVRDLARVCGVHCVELSCVPHTTAATAANLVVGAAQSGAWLCIDNAQHCSTRARWWWGGFADYPPSSCLIRLFTNNIYLVAVALWYWLH